MARSAASIQSEIDILETRLTATAGLLESGGGDGSSFRYSERVELQKRLDQLYQQLGRANGDSPMFARGKTVPR